MAVTHTTKTLGFGLENSNFLDQYIRPLSSGTTGLFLVQSLGEWQHRVSPALFHHQRVLTIVGSATRFPIKQGVYQPNRDHARQLIQAEHPVKACRSRPCSDLQIRCNGTTLFPNFCSLLQAIDGRNQSQHHVFSTR